MTEATVRERLLNEVRTMSGVPVEVGTLLADEGVLDSMAFVQLVAHVEEHYGVSFDQDELESAFATVQSIASHVARKMAGAS